MSRPNPELHNPMVALPVSREDISSIYAAAAEPDALQRMIVLLRRIFDVDSVGLWLTDHGRIVDITLSEAIAESMPDYLAHFYRLDPWGGATPRFINQATLGTDQISEDVLVKTEFYNDFARHYGMKSPLGLAAAIGPGLLVAIGLNRSEGSIPLSAEDKPVLEDVGFHITAALRLHHRFTAEREAGRWPHAAFDALSFGVVICTEAAAIRYVNPAAFELARRRGGVVLGDRTVGLQARTPPETERLRGVIAAAARGCGGAISLMGEDGIPLSILATPLPSEDPTALSGRVFLCMRRNDAAPSITQGTLQQLFGLSPTQALLCTQLATGKTFEDVAAERGIAISTARTHFQTIFAKTKTRNLRDLLRLLGALPPVLLS